MSKKYKVTGVKLIGDDVLVSFNDKSELVINRSVFNEIPKEKDDNEIKREIVLGMYEEKDGKSFLVDEGSGISVEI